MNRPAPVIQVIRHSAALRQTGQQELQPDISTEAFYLINSSSENNTVK
jgi:hypothetical protein